MTSKTTITSTAIPPRTTSNSVAPTFILPLGYLTRLIPENTAGVTPRPAA